jgi:hypothetical protein
MCLSRLFWLASKAGAAVLSGKMFPVMLSAWPCSRIRLLSPTLDELFLFRALLQVFSQVVGLLLTFQLVLFGL